MEKYRSVKELDSFLESEKKMLPYRDFLLYAFRETIHSDSLFLNNGIITGGNLNIIYVLNNNERDTHKDFSLILKNIYQVFLVPKCGNTTLKNIEIFQKFGSFDESIFNIHCTLNLKKEPKYRIGYNNSFIKVAVIRNPFKRFVSTYQNKIVQEKASYYKKYSDVYDGISFKDFLMFAYKELCNKPCYLVDEHIRLQSTFYESEKIDEFVWLEDLDAWLDERGIEKPPHHMNVSSRITSEEQQGFEKYRIPIEHLYKDDYDMIERVKDKIWKNPNK